MRGKGDKRKEMQWLLLSDAMPCDTMRSECQHQLTINTLASIQSALQDISSCIHMLKKGLATCYPLLVSPYLCVSLSISLCLSCSVSLFLHLSLHMQWSLLSISMSCDAKEANADINSPSILRPTYRQLFKLSHLASTW